MSLALSRLGRFISRHRLLVLGAWAVVLAMLIGGLAASGSAFRDDFTIPGTESQQGQEVLEARFSGASGASAQALYRADDGRLDEGELEAVGASLEAIAEIDGVEGVTGLDDLRLDDAGDAALATVQFTDAVPADETLDAVAEAVHLDDGVTATIGGAAYGNATGEVGHTAEIVGVIIALIVLTLTFGSLLSAGMPIVSALAGVGATVATLSLASHVTAVSTTTPSFAVMLGLAVGIDYALFVLSRYRAALRHGATVEDGMAEALGTSGSAVVFAGLTVVVSLAGLTVTGVPVLAVMGLAGGLAVLVSVVSALTLLPAVALLLGERLRPRERAPRRRSRPGRRTLGQRWVALATRVPIVTVIAVTGLLGVASIPAASLALALPDAGTQPVGSEPREHFDAVAETFGPGYNAPLIVTADLLGSDEPVDAVDALEAALRDVPGVVDVTVATPNEQADTALFRIVPEGGQSDPATTELVHELRERADDLAAETGVDDILVTGTTAINIDVSERLAAAMTPFALTVVGLSLLLLLVVFRSIAVPIKATVGYLLSVGASFGAIVAVFQWGWLADLFGVAATGPVVSFLPILVIGVLFGLAMDYEMFLVSRMREEFARHGDARRAVHVGFEHSAPVVAAAAAIMVGVFASFVPTGSATLKPIALGLAVGVFVDAFLVRMTLVPAVLVLLGRHAWWLPRPLARVLPTVDVEGEALHRAQAVSRRAEADGASAVHAAGVVVRAGDAPFDLVVPPAGAATIAVADADAEAAVAAALTGRGRFSAGELVVHGRLLPDERERVRRRSAVIQARTSPAAGPVGRLLRANVRLATASPRRRREMLERARLLLPDGVGLDSAWDDLDAATARGVLAALAVGAGAETVVLLGPADPDLARRLTAAGAAVVMFTRDAATRGPRPLGAGDGALALEAPVR